MVSTSSRRGRLRLVALATGLGVWVVSVSSSFAQQSACTSSVHCSKNPKVKHNPQAKTPASGFQGFGLGYHLGYGFGGKELGFGHGPYAMGVGAEGGYPNYGGPGYPHPAPFLSRKLPIVPFCHFAGPGYPTPENPNFFGDPAGPLVTDQPVITFENDPSLPMQPGGYGSFDGTLPYPESTFAPFTTMIGEYGMGSGSSSANSAPPASTALGMVFEPFTETGRTPGMKITNVAASGVAEKAGLQVGDILVSMNGYVTQKLTDPEWIILNASPDKVLKMMVRSASDAKERQLTARLP
jgi:hypothetical protein